MLIEFQSIFVCFYGGFVQHRL